MLKEERVTNFYVICNKLKTLIRKGWLCWNIEADRVESVAEHIYSTQMLAIQMKQEYNYDVDLYKVLFMLAIHELGEIEIGDLTLFDIDNESKEVIEHKTVHQILDNVIGSEYIEELFLEFDEKKTKEAIFAYQCDKLECDLQCRVYDEEGAFDPNVRMCDQAKKNERVQELLDQGKSLSEMWIYFDIERLPYDDNFKAVAEYAMNNKITKI